MIDEIKENKEMNKLIILLLIILIAYAFKAGWFSTPKNSSKKDYLKEILEEVKRCRELLEKFDSQGSRPSSEKGDDDESAPLLG